MEAYRRLRFAKCSLDHKERVTDFSKWNGLGAAIIGDMNGKGWHEGLISDNKLIPGDYFHYDGGEGKHCYNPQTEKCGFDSVRLLTDVKYFGDNPDITMDAWVNLTPHPIMLHRDKKVTRWDGAAYDAAARLKESYGEPDKNGVRNIQYTEVLNLPNPASRIMFIVSLPLLLGMKAAGINRPDCIAPDTGDGAVREKEGKFCGRIIGTRGFIRLKNDQLQSRTEELEKEIEHAYFVHPDLRSM